MHAFDLPVVTQRLSDIAFNFVIIMMIKFDNWKDLRKIAAT